MCPPAGKNDQEHVAAGRRLVAALVGLRRSAGLTQAQVAERMGVGQPAISQLEAGTGRPYLLTLQRYAAAVGTRLRVELTDN